MNLVNITDNDLKLMLKYIKGEDLVETDLIDELENKLEYCVAQIDLRNEYMDKVEKVNNKYKEEHKGNNEEVE